MAETHRVALLNEAHYSLFKSGAVMDGIKFLQYTRVGDGFRGN